MLRRVMEATREEAPARSAGEADPESVVEVLQKDLEGLRRIEVGGLLQLAGRRGDLVRRRHRVDGWELMFVDLVVFGSNGDVS